MEVARDDGSYIGIILVLWQKGRVHIKQLAEVLWFERPTAQDAQPVRRGALRTIMQLIHVE